MCAFVLLGGVHRSVPAEARVMVHQIWLGDRRDDPTAANYSAEDLVLVQRDIGRLAQYTAEMGASDRSARSGAAHSAVGADACHDARRIAPHAACDRRAHRRRRRPSPPLPAAPAQPLPRVTDGARATAISEQRWAMVDRAGTAALARHHPLTVEGEDIGSFDLMVACGAGGDSYDVSYVERRRGGERMANPASSAVTMTAGQ